ncbi:DNA repair protein RecN [Synechococcus sp. PCC 7335]|uniref:DNA repair protein RecN n=1 Tax=Synechococcus sp. (strain ATCC 29403 / PCC 7335) TaxID=91464 RepID=UPI00017EC374|nr:DNA repair protein RecN [Synechococcus sp. PCC 7335]EDX85952.1 DNA repair protein RecN [Synechococcus sp. PCC 7335]
MLVSLKIENFALIDQLELELKPGLNVLTGETGAGKSIILDAIDAVLGGKASGRWVRTGTEKALVEATFQVDTRLSGWLSEQAIPDGGAIITCRRDLTAGKNSVRSKSRLNGIPVKKPQMDALRQLLIEITAQGQTLQLGDHDLQRDWLDGFGDQKLLEQKGQVAANYAAASSAKKILDARRQADRQRAEQIEMLQFQNKEFSEAALEDPNELEDLQIEHQRLSHSVELQQQSYQVYQMLYENDDGSACSDLLGDAETVLTDMLRFDPDINPIIEMVAEALAQVQEAGQQINAYGENIETDPERLDQIEARISQLKQLCRKYNRDLPELIEHYQTIQASLASMGEAGQSIEELEKAYQHKQAKLLESCDRLTKLRQAAAKKLEADLVTQLKPLAMERVKFKVDIQSQVPTIHGGDAIAFLFSPNPGEPLQPLADIASGGEMSRFLLALKACFSKVDPISTMVFDEIDVGVSGRVAQAIAEKLHQLSREHQVLCVTHQPLVAAMADAHYHVGKHVIASATEPASKHSQKPKSKSAQTQLLEAVPTKAPTKEEAKALEKIAAQTRRHAKGRSQDQTKGKTKEAKARTDAGERTIVRVTPLGNTEARRDELAQLAGGRSHSEAIAFADSLLAQAETIRKAG